MAKSKGRPVRAFGDVGHEANGKLQQDEAKSSAASRQSASPGGIGSGMSAVDSQGRSMGGVDAYMVPDFMGRSGQPDNQSISRGKGRT